MHATLATYVYFGYFESDVNFVGSWRLVPGDPMFDGRARVPPMFDAHAGLHGNGLYGRGAAGVLGGSSSFSRLTAYLIAHVEARWSTCALGRSLLDDQGHRGLKEHPRTIPPRPS